MAEKTYGAASARGRETSFESKKNMLHSMANRFHLSMRSRGIAVDVEDVFQELSINYLKAKEAFNPDRGVAFSTYLYVSAQNILRKMAKDLSAYNAVVGPSIEELGNHEDDDGPQSLDYLMEDIAARSPEDILMAKQSIARSLAYLSPLSKWVIKELLSPSPKTRVVLVRLSEQQKESAEIAGSRFGSYLPRTLVRELLCEHGIAAANRDAVLEELGDVLEEIFELQ